MLLVLVAKHEPRRSDSKGDWNAPTAHNVNEKVAEKFCLWNPRGFVLKTKKNKIKSSSIWCSNKFLFLILFVSVPAVETKNFINNYYFLRCDKDKFLFNELSLELLIVGHG